MTKEQEQIVEIILRAEDSVPDLLQNIKSTTSKSKLRTLPKAITSLSNMSKEDLIKMVFFRPIATISPESDRRNGMRLSHLGQSFLTTIAESFKINIEKPFSPYDLMLIDRYHVIYPWYYEEFDYPSYMKQTAKMQTLISYDKMFAMNMKLSDNNLDFVLQK